MTCARVLLMVLLVTGCGHPLSGQSLSQMAATTAGPGDCGAVPCASGEIGRALADSGAGAEAVPGGVVHDLVKPLGRDFKRLFTSDSAIWLGVGGAAALAVHAHDHQVTSSLVTSPAEEPLDGGSVIGGGAVQFGLALGTYAVGRLGHKSDVAALGADLVRAQVVAGALTQGIKFAVDRTRPDGSHFSFPSGHTSSAFATATVLQRYYGWKVGVPAFALAGYVGTSRMAENRHYLSDVLFGAAIGVISAHAVTFGHGRHTFALTPVAVPGGAGVGLVHVG